MNNLALYHKVFGQLCQWLPAEPATRRSNLAWLIVGAYLSASVHLAHIVRHWAVRSKQPSLVNRLHRFLTNGAVQPGVYYEPLASQLLATFASRPLRLVMDTTKVGRRHRALVLALAYRRRTLPLAWSIHEGDRGNVAVVEQIKLLAAVYRLLPYGCPTQLTAAAAFRATDLLSWLRDHQWGYVIRQRQESYVRYPDGEWSPIADLARQPGQTRVVGWVWLAKTNPFGLTWLVIGSAAEHGQRRRGALDSGLRPA